MESIRAVLQGYREGNREAADNDAASLSFVFDKAPHAQLSELAELVLDGTPAATLFLDATLWELIPGVLGCLDDSGGPPAAIRLLRGAAAIANPREVLLIATSHLSAHNSPGALGVISEMAASSFARLPAQKRRAFLDSAVPAISGRITQLASSFSSAESPAAAADETGASSDGDEDDDDAVAGVLGPAAGQDAVKAAEAAAKAVVVATSFARPLLGLPFEEQAPRVASGDASVAECAAQDPQVAAPLASLLLTAIEIAMAAAALQSQSDASEASPSSSAAPPSCGDDALAATELLLRVPGVELEFLLEYPCREKYSVWLSERRRWQRARRLKGQRETNGGGTGGASSSGDAVIPSSLGGLTLAPPLPWRESAVAAAAYAAVCDAQGKRRWMPKVWSARHRWELCWPHAEALLRSDSPPVAMRGIAFLAAAALPLRSDIPPPGAPGVFPIRLRPEPTSESASCGDSHRAAAPPAFDPFACDAQGLLQLLINSIVACPEASLRLQGHAALEAVIAAVEPSKRFGLLEALVVQCPFPNKGGLLIDCFRKHVRAAKTAKLPTTTAENGSGGARAAAGAAAGSALPSEDPFASPKVGSFITKRLKVMADCPPATLLASLDVHLAVLNLLRFCLVAFAADSASASLSPDPLALFDVSVRAEQGALLRRFRAHVRGELAEANRLAEAEASAELKGEQEQQGHASGVAAAAAAVPEVGQRLPAAEFFRLAMAEEAADGVLLLLGGHKGK